VRAMLAVASTIVALGVTAAPAGAGTYDVWSCRLPDGKAAPLDGWRFDGYGPGVNQCPYFGFTAGLPNSAVSAGATAGWWFEPPPSLLINGYELYRAARAGVGADGTHRAYALYHDVPTFDPLVHLFEFCLPSAGCYEQGAPFPSDVMGSANRVVRNGINARRLILRMECRPVTGPPRDCGPADPGGVFAVSRARITLNDALPPVLDPPSGPLMTPGAVLEGVQAVNVVARDEGGGVQRLSVLADGQPAFEQTLEDIAPTCRQPFVKVVPCAGSTVRTIGFDTGTLPNGKHSIQIAAIDAAGNATVSDAVAVTTLNGATPNGAGATRRAHLAAAFAARRSRRASHRATIGFRGRRTVTGRLTDADGAPIAGAVIDVMRQRRGGKPRREGAVKTRSNGRFRYVTRRGPSRLLRVEYRAFSLDDAPSAVSTVTLRVRAGIRLVVHPRRTTSRGTIRFAGRLLGGPGRNGVQVTLYAVGRVGRQRVPVSVLRTDAKGRFRFRYRFRRTFAPFTYRFQARVGSQPAYPYAAAGSNRATVRVER
jgi:hypothetical protein